jgi:hypothetical protein
MMQIYRVNVAKKFVIMMQKQRPKVATINPAKKRLLIWISPEQLRRPFHAAPSLACWNSTVPTRSTAARWEI